MTTKQPTRKPPPPPGEGFSQQVQPLDRPMPMDPRKLAAAIFEVADRKLPQRPPKR